MTEERIKLLEERIKELEERLKFNEKGIRRVLDNQKIVIKNLNAVASKLPGASHD